MTFAQASLASQHKPESALASLLAPVTTDEFLTQHWEQAVLRIHRQDRDYFRRLLSPEAIENVLTTACLSHSDAVELLGEMARTETNCKRDSVSSIASAFDRGATVRIRNTQRFHPPLLKLTRDLERTFSAPVRINLYWTPGRQQGLSRHWDTHDVLVLQVAGRKHWRVFEAPVKLPLQAPPPLPFEDHRTLYRTRGAVRSEELMRELAGASALREEFILEQGDVLYLPRGVPHEAWTSAPSSVHLTVGLHVLTWTDLLAVALGQVANQDERFRRALPLGFAAETLGGEAGQQQAQELLRSFVQHLNVTPAFEELAEVFIHTRPSISGNLQAGTENIAALDPQTCVGPRSGLLCRLIIKTETVALYFGHGEFEAPRAMEDALRFIATTERFRVDEVPGGLSRRNQLALVRHLIAQRFLCIVPDRADLVK
ncbi:MAG: cupin-like domain-containing protein [Blastocatellia bacterium]|nr:cupin-like domain-containing protein [Blastocatellia bacterium]